MTGPLPYDAEVNPVFPIRTWVARLGHLEPWRSALVEDIVAELGDVTSDGPRITAPVLQDRDESRWTDTIEAVTTFTDALAVQLRPRWRHRQVFAWGSAARSGAGGAGAIDALTAYGAATFTCLLWLQVPSELTSVATLALRDPLYHLQERYGGPGYAAVVPAELSMLVLPGFLERFGRVSDIEARWSRPAISIQADVCYY